MSGLGVGIREFGWKHPGRDRWALRGLNLAIDEGERVLIAGASGSGKSTLLRSIAGLGDPEDAAGCEGEISYRLGGKPVTAEQARRGTGLMLQDPETNLLMTRVGDDVAFGLENAQVPSELIWPSVSRALEAVDYPYGLDRPTAALSGGEKQRVALAALLARSPQLLILDEPTANLDADGARLSVDAIGAVLAGFGPTMVIVEHRIGEVLDLIDRIVVLSPGGVLADGPPASVLRDHRDIVAAAGVFTPGWRAEAGVPISTPSMSQEVVLWADTVSLVRKGQTQPALSEISVAITAGSATVIAGRNGAGKSTLARILGGLLAPSEGTAQAGPGGKPLIKLRSKELVRTVGSVFQEPEHQFVTGSVQAELAVGARAAGCSKGEAAARAAELMAALGLEHLANINPFTLSGGEKRRLAVAAAVAARPPVLVLDEPTFGQDVNSWTAIVRLLIDQLNAGTAMVAVTHDEALAEVLGAHVVVLEQGRHVASPSGMSA